jgi:Xaa-Pro aminopeptidase
MRERLAGRRAERDAAARVAELRQAARRALRGVPGRDADHPERHEKVRANDTDYPFRPGSDFVYLTGDRDPDSVLVLRPSGSGHDAVLYTRQRNSKDTDAFFRSRDGELWVGRRHTLAEKSTELGIETAAYGELGAPWPSARRPAPGCCAAWTRTSTGRCWPTSRPRTRRDRELAG